MQKEGTDEGVLGLGLGAGHLVILLAGCTQVSVGVRVPTCKSPSEQQERVLLEFKLHNRFNFILKSVLCGLVASLWDV